MLGNSNTMFCSCLELFLSLLPAAVLRKVFPPIITCLTVILIGITLTGVGIKYWGGGVVCGDMIWKDHVHAVAADVEFPNPSQICTNGDVQLP
jgi:xanthine/uracil permease